MAAGSKKTTYTAAEVASLEDTILKQQQEIAELKRKLEHMNEVFANAQRARFGQSSEKASYVLKEGTSASHETLESMMPWSPEAQQQCKQAKAVETA